MPEWRNVVAARAVPPRSRGRGLVSLFGTRAYLNILFLIHPMVALKK